LITQYMVDGLHAFPNLEWQGTCKQKHVSSLQGKGEDNILKHKS